MVRPATFTARNENYRVWTHDDHPLQMQPHFIMQRVNYIHQNPVRAGWVDQPRDYLYSSARDYRDEPGLLKVERVWWFLRRMAVRGFLRVAVPLPSADRFGR